MTATALDRARVIPRRHCVALSSKVRCVLGGGEYGEQGEKIGKRGTQGSRLGLCISGFLIRFFLLRFLLRSLFLVPCFVFLHISFFLSKILLVSFVIFSGASCSTSFVLILLSTFTFTFHFVGACCVFFKQSVMY